MSKAYIYEQKSILKTARIWLDANNAASLGNPVNDDPISQWNDISGSGDNATQTTPTRQPLYKTNAINGLPALRFDGINDFMLANGIASVADDSHTIFIVMKMGAVGSDGEAIIAWNSAGGDNTEVLYIYGTSQAAPGQIVRFVGGSFDLILDQDIRNSTSLLTFVVDFGATTNDITSYLNGIENLTVNSANPNAGTTFSIGQEYDGTSPSNFLTGDIGEIIIFDRVLQESQRKAIEAYLSNKWSI